MSAALEIMGWCGMPAAGDGWVPSVSVPRDELRDRHWVTQAERVLVERGHQEAYGLALMNALGTVILTKRGAAALATAPLDVRIRAILSVIRATPPTVGGAEGV